ncbi:DUF1572 family protein [Pseudalkalibacillus salsuginis]|uniref:DUF1572 family protein n=1 Tax=Pseudalkalibacillus salsuginis TaxID=2910972 RepID=UPI001F41B161|nr:DUF1572 family protein [Pseudalkalibacillus salsuginis]MCF6409349.1 DUF1572 domain-containing protein [Pseudalkalibacillus salsuginis]
MESISTFYLEEVKSNIKGLKTQGERVFLQLSTEELFWTPNTESNSIAIIVKHLSGNMVSRWTDFLTTDGEKPDRHRDTEFIDDMETKEELMAIWEKGWDVFLKTIDSLSEEDMMKTVYIRKEPLNVLSSIQRQITHYSSHIGQIIYIGKQLKGSNWDTLSIPRGKSDQYMP